MGDGVEGANVPGGGGAGQRAHFAEQLGLAVRQVEQHVAKRELEDYAMTVRR